MAQDTVEKIKERLSIVDVVMPYVKLTKSGKYYKGLSPFTKEKTPSFFVSPDRGLYHCFSSGKGGDMFTFIQELEGVDFKGALALLAEKAGVEIVHEPQEKRDIREKIYSALADAAGWFEKNLEQNKEAEEYLLKRGLTKETLTLWRVGFALPEWRALSLYLQDKGYSEATLESAGLIKRPEAKEGEDTKNEGITKRPYDRFRSRIMFPLSDVSGRVVGFSGRAFGGDGVEVAKYLNSPETSVFSKSHVLHGIHFAKEGIRALGSALLVEGQVDLLMAHQVGYKNAVALSGTGFTEEHGKLIKRYTENLLMAFDGDRAGVSAAGRAAQVALKLGINVKIATLPPGEDPADLIKRDVTLWKKAVKESQHVVDFYISYLKNAGFDERRFKLEVSRVVLPYIALIPHAIDRAHFVSKVAGVLHVPVHAVEIELEKVERGVKIEHASTIKSASSGASSKVVDTTVSAAYEPFLSRGDTLERLLFGVYEALKSDDAQQELATWLHAGLVSSVGEDRLKELAGNSTEMRVALIEGDLFLESHQTVRDMRELLGEVLLDLQKEMRRSEYQRAVTTLRLAEEAGDYEQTQTFLKQVSDLAKGL